jgi:hypothetical protein
MLLAEPLRITQRITEILEQLSIPYLVGGSLASSLHGIPRATQDVDMVADIKLHHIPLLVNALETEFYIDADMIREAIQHHSSFNVIHLETLFKVDIFVLQADLASQEEMARRESYQVSDNPPQILFLASAEDIILHKLYWFQLGGGVSERQWNDVLGVLQVRHDTLDYEYLRRGAQYRGVSQLLEQALREAQLEDPST